jgi:hypothetical protein
MIHCCMEGSEGVDAVELQTSSPDACHRQHVTAAPSRFYDNDRMHWSVDSELTSNLVRGTTVTLSGCPEVNTEIPALCRRVPPLPLIPKPSHASRIACPSVQHASLRHLPIPNGFKPRHLSSNAAAVDIAKRGTTPVTTTAIAIPTSCHRDLGDAGAVMLHSVAAPAVIGWPPAPTAIGRIDWWAQQVPKRVFTGAQEPCSPPPHVRPWPCAPQPSRPGATVATSAPLTSDRVL